MVQFQDGNNVNGYNFYIAAVVNLQYEPQAIVYLEPSFWGHNQ